MAIFYRFASYLTSIICNSIISTALICSLISPAYLATSPFSASTPSSSSTPIPPFSTPSSPSSSSFSRAHHNFPSNKNWIAISTSRQGRASPSSSSCLSYHRRSSTSKLSFSFSLAFAASTAPSSPNNYYLSLFNSSLYNQHHSGVSSHRYHQYHQYHGIHQRRMQEFVYSSNVTNDSDRPLSQRPLYDAMNDDDATVQQQQQHLSNPPYSRHISLYGHPQHFDFDYGADKPARTLYNRQESLRSRHRRLSSSSTSIQSGRQGRASAARPLINNDQVYLRGPPHNLFDGSERKGFVVLTFNPTATGESPRRSKKASAVVQTRSDQHQDRRYCRQMQAQRLRQCEQQYQDHDQSMQHSTQLSQDSYLYMHTGSNSHNHHSTSNDNDSHPPKGLSSLLGMLFAYLMSLLSTIQLTLQESLHASSYIMHHLFVILCRRYTSLCHTYEDSHDGLQGIECNPWVSSSFIFLDTMQTSTHMHAPQRLIPNPVIAMLATNLWIRTALLAILCVGALYYFIMVMEQQQPNMVGSSSANWRTTTDHQSSSTTSSHSSVNTRRARSTTAIATPAPTAASTFLTTNGPIDTRALETVSTPTVAGEARDITVTIAPTIDTASSPTILGPADLNGSSGSAAATLVVNHFDSNTNHNHSYHQPSVAAIILTVLIRSTMTLACEAAVLSPPHSASTTPQLVQHALFFKKQQRQDPQPLHQHRRHHHHHQREEGTGPIDIHNAPKNSNSNNSSRNDQNETLHSTLMTTCNKNVERMDYMLDNHHYHMFRDLGYTMMDSAESSQSSSWRSCITSAYGTSNISFLCYVPDITQVGQQQQQQQQQQYHHHHQHQSGVATMTTFGGQSPQGQCSGPTLSFYAQFYNVDALRSTLLHRHHHHHPVDPKRVSSLSQQRQSMCSRRMLSNRTSSLPATTRTQTARYRYIHGMKPSPRRFRAKQLRLHSLAIQKKY